MTILSWEQKTRLTCLRVKRTAAQRLMMTDHIFKKLGSSTWESLLMSLDTVCLLLAVQLRLCAFILRVERVARQRILPGAFGLPTGFKSNHLRRETRLETQIPPI